MYACISASNSFAPCHVSRHKLVTTSCIQDNEVEADALFGPAVGETNAAAPSKAQALPASTAAKPAGFSNPFEEAVPLDAASSAQVRAEPVSQSWRIVIANGAAVRSRPVTCLVVMFKLILQQIVTASTITLFMSFRMKLARSESAPRLMMCCWYYNYYKSLIPSKLRTVAIYLHEYQL